MDQVLDVLTQVVAEGRRQPPDAEVHAVKRMLVDSVGCVLGSYRERVPAIIRDVVAGRASASGAGVLGAGFRAPADLAAFANSVMIRFLDYNDSYGSLVGIGHPSDYIPAALASFDGSDISGERAIRGILVAYEVFCRLTDATRLGVEKIDHVVNGAVASAAASAVVNGLSDVQAREAMSLALTANLSLQATRLGTLSMWKGCAAGNACRNGVFAAQLAAAGLTGPEAPFVGRGGLFGVIGEEPDMDALTRTGRRAAIGDCHVKRFPSGYFSQGAIEAALAVRPALDGEPPAAVTVGTFEFGKRVMAGDPEKWRPTTRETADHSIPYVVACALARGSVKRADLDESELADPRVRQILDVLTVEVDPECMAAWPEACMNRITVQLPGGGSKSETVRYYRGHCANPMDDAELEAKFGEQAQSVLPGAQAAAVLAAIWELESARSLDGLFSWALPARLRRAEVVEYRPVPPDREPQLLGVRGFALGVPLVPQQPLPLVERPGECLRDMLHQLGGLRHRAARVIHECGLEALPGRAQVVRVRQQRPVHCRAGRLRRGLLVWSYGAARGRGKFDSHRCYSLATSTTSFVAAAAPSAAAAPPAALSAGPSSSRNITRYPTKACLSSSVDRVPAWSVTSLARRYRSRARAWWTESSAGSFPPSAE